MSVTRNITHRMGRSANRSVSLGLLPALAALAVRLAGGHESLAGDSAGHSAEYSSGDFGRLVRENPLVVSGEIRRPLVGVAGAAGAGGTIAVQRVLKAPRGVTGLEAGSEIALGATSNNLFWSRSVIQRPEGHVSVWVLQALEKAGRLEAAEVVAHFTTEESTLDRPGAGKKGQPLEQWSGVPGGRQWAVVKVANATVYTLKGQYSGTLGAGVVMDVIMVTNLLSGDVVVARREVEDEANGAGKEFVVLSKEVNIHPGELAGLDARRRALCVQEAMLQARLRQVWFELADQARAGNPHSTEYRTAKAAYDQYWGKVKDLQRRRDAAQGTDRMKSADELRALKGGDIPVGIAFEKARKKYEGWQSGQPRKDFTSPEMEAMKKDLAAVREQLRRLP